MQLTIFGANGRTGQLLTQHALGGGHRVTAVMRHPDTFPVEHSQLTVLRGDALEAKSVEAAVAGADAVLSTLGVPYSFRPISSYSSSAANVIEAMKRHGVRRLACVSSTASRRYDNGGGFVFEHVLKPLIAGTIGRTTYVDQRRMERLVMDSGLDWTIVRPSGLFETDSVTLYELTETNVTGKFTSRADLADALLRQAIDGRHVRSAIAVATVAEQPQLMRIILREAFHRPV